MQTTIAVLRALNAPLTVEECDTPPLGTGQVLVQVVASGLCHTQVNEIRGRKGPDRYLPHALGHEGAGIIMETGPGVAKVTRGDHVVLTWMKGSGTDVPACVYAAGADARINSGAIATFGTMMVLAENRVVPIPRDVPFDIAALLGCALLTGGGMVRHTARAAPGMSLAVFGVGGVGMSAVAVAGMLGCHPIIAVDVHDAKLQSARALGAHAVVNAMAGDVASRVREQSGGGATVAIEAAGRKEAMEAAFQSLDPARGLLIIAGNLPRGTTIAIDPYECIVGKRIVGSWGGEAQPDIDIPFYIDAYRRGMLPLDRCITHRFPLANINEAVRVLESDPTVTRIIIDCTTAP